MEEKKQIFCDRSIIKKRIENLFFKNAVSDQMICFMCVTDGQ